MKDLKLSTVVVAIGVAGWIGGCSSTQLASPSTSPATQPSASPVIASPSIGPSATPAATPVPSASAPPEIGLAPEGRWTSIRWIDAAGGFPRLATAPSDLFDMNVYGWSGGYVAFASDGGQGTDPARPPTLVSSSSVDGLHWSAASKIDVSGFPDQVDIAQVVEGPSGLLGVGRFPADTCGGPPVVAGLWHSTDGTTWRPIALPRNMVRGHVETIDGGSAGYIATGKQSDQKTAGIWLSLNGTTWRALANPKPSSGTLVVNDATSFNGGLVVAGAVIGEEGCGGPASIHPAVWWSADGSSWTRESLPNPTAASLTVHRLNDDTIVAVSQAGDTPDAWISTDGKTWTLTPKPTIEALFGTLSDGRRSIAVLAPSGDQGGPPSFQTIGDQLDLAPLSQSGDGPVQTADSTPTVTAVGPTGLVVVSVDGSQLWLGVPSS
jgi:hypothetical protein